MRTGVFLLLGAACASAAIAAQPAVSSPAEGTAAVSSGAVRTRAETLLDLAGRLESGFVFPEVGIKYAAMLRAAASSGKYDRIGDDAEFAKQVTADLHAIAYDGHLKLVLEKKKAKPGGGAPPVEPKTIEATARLSDEVAYIRFGAFFGEPEAVAAIRKFIADNSEADVLIVDVRTHVGGGLDEMDAMFPHLFANETALVQMDTRVSIESPIGDGPTVRRIAGSNAVVRREHFVTPAAGSKPLADASVYVLTSGRTASAGEHFVLALKRTGRATVIGETTYGAGNYGMTEKIAGGFQTFIAVGRTFDPDTDKGWDYSGIAPHVAVPAGAALVEALVLSGMERSEAEALSERHGPAAPLR
jgi:hypothetical protein